MTYSIQSLYRNSVFMLCMTFIVVLTPCLAAFSYYKERLQLQNTLDIQAHMFATSVTDERMPSVVIRQAMSALAINDRVRLVCYYDKDDHVRASYQSEASEDLGASDAQCTKLATASPEKEMLTAAAVVMSGAVPSASGKVKLFAVTPELFANVGYWFLSSIMMGLLLALLCWALGQRLRLLMIKPIQQIASTAQRVSLYKDYSLRVVPGALEVAPKEIESLTESFNAMLKEIEDRDSRLSRKSIELERARQTAESASQAKSQFLANVSHELRTPLNAIIGFSKMISEEQFGPLSNPKYVEYAHDIQDSGKHLLDVINDILDLTRAETGRLSVTFASLSVSKVIEKALRIVAGHAYHRKVDIYTDIPDKLPKLIADPVRLVQILLNLLSNAIKFSPDGGKVTIRVRAETARQGVHYFMIEVEDHGIGMSEAELNKVFSSFNQADVGLNRKYDGAGLGLPLTKRLVELHHGKIKIESKEGKGTVVTVRLTSDPALLD